MRESKYTVYPEACKHAPLRNSRARSFLHFTRAKEYAQTSHLCPFIGCNHKSSVMFGSMSTRKQIGYADATGWHDTL